MIATVYQLRTTAAPSVTRKAGRTFRKYQALLTGSQALTKGEINSLAWALNGLKKVDLTNDERAELRQLLAARDERPITKEQSDFGIEWLRRLAYRKNGEPRQNKGQPFGYRERAIINDFARFTWLGYHDTQADYGNYRGDLHSYTPVWRCHAANGAYFDYYVRAGGPGGSCDVLICT